MNARKKGATEPDGVELPDLRDLGKSPLTVSSCAMLKFQRENTNVRAFYLLFNNYYSSKRFVSP